MDNEIKKKNMIPGSCDEFTRPEEIQQLSKYLKKVKTALEDNLYLNDKNLEFRGSKFLDSPTELPDRLAVLSPGEKEVSSLVSSKEWLDNDKDLKELKSTKETLGGEEKKIEDLRAAYEGVPGQQKSIDALSRIREAIMNAEKEDDQLEDRITKLGGEIREAESLENYKEGLKDGNLDDLGLSSYLEGLGGEKKERENLEDHQEKIGGDAGKEHLLEDHRETLEGVNAENILEDHREDLGESSEDVDALSSYRDTLEGTEDKNLSDYREDLKDATEDVEGLEDHKEKLGDVSKDNSLEDTKERIVGSVEDYDLSDYRENLEDVDDVKGLSDYKETLEDTKDVESLEDHKEELGDVDTVESLEDYREGLDDQREPELSNYREELEDERDPKLSDYREDLNDQRENELSDYRENIEVPVDQDLEDTKVVLEDTRDTNLSNEKIQLEDVVEETPLSDTKVELEDVDQESELEDTRLVLEDTREPELSDHREVLEGIEDQDLEDTKVVLEDTRDTNLSNEKIQLEDVVEETPLSDTKVELEDVDQESELEDTRIDLEDLRTTSLEDYTEELYGEVKDLDSLEDERLGIIGDVEDNNLHGDETIQKIYHEGPESLEDFIDSLEGPEDHGLEDTVIGRTEDASRPNEGGEWSDGTGLYDSSLAIAEDKSVPGWDENLEDERLDLVDDREPELHDESTRISEEDENVVGWGENLEDFIDNLEDTRDNKLYDESTRISEADANEVGWDENLEDERLDLEDDRENKLHDESTRISEDDSNEVGWDESLEDFVDNLEDTRDNELHDESTRISEEDENPEGWKGDLEDEKIERTEDASRPNEGGEWGDNTGLYDSTLEVSEDKNEDGWDESLENEKLNLEGPEDAELHDESTRISKADTNEVGWDESLGDYKENLIADDTSKVNTDRGPDKALLTGDDIITGTHSRWEGDKLHTSNSKGAEDKNEDGWDEDLKNILNSRDDLHLYYTNLLKFTQNKNLNKGWGKKVSGLVSAYLSGSDISPTKAEEFERQLYSSIILDQEDQPDSHGFIKVPRYKLGKFNLFGNGLSPSAYLRWVAEETVGQIHLHGNLRALLMDETLGLLIYARDMLEKVTKSNRDRLPGLSTAGGILAAGMQGGLAGAAKAAVTAGAKALLGGSSVDMSIPQNRPEKKEETENFTALNEKSQESSETKKVDGGKKYNFRSNYIKDDKDDKRFKGFQTTIDELIGEGTEIKTVEDLYAALKGAPYISTAGKVTSSTQNPLKVFTLDNNAHWEVIFTPFLGTENGNRSYLPPISEINVWNKLYHGVQTGYGTWIPINGFELSKSKITSKTLPLFDGEISYPVSMEFTNELRLTFVDDQYKSWRTYFERCMDCAIYNSQIHIPADYGDDANLVDLTWNLSEYEIDDSLAESKAASGILKSVIASGATKLASKALAAKSGASGLTAIDKKYQCVAPYKNITFRCTIFSLTPQMSTVSRYDLLVVLKDFIEERSGDVDGEPGDLTVSFSIVGENPKEDRKKITPPNLKDLKKKFNEDKMRKGQGAASIIGNSVSKVIGVL